MGHSMRVAGQSLWDLISNGSHPWRTGALVGLLLTLSAFPSYLREDFATDLTNIPNAPNGQGAWTNNFWYGRAGIVIPVPTPGANANTFSNNLSRQVFSNGKLVFWGEPNPVDGNSSRDGRWKGKWLWNTNRFGASVYQPFGWEIIRERCFIEPSTGGTWVPNTLDARKHAMIGLAMIYDNPATLVNKAYGSNRNNEYEAFERYVDFVDHCGCWASSNNDMRQMISYYDGSEVSLNQKVALATSPSGAVTNVSSILNWNYNLTVNASTATNTNAVGFRMVHTGSSIAYYVNPNPYDALADMPNEWLYLDERGVTWTNGFQIMVGTQVYGFSGYLGNEFAWASFDNLLVRNATVATGFWVQPLELPSERDVHYFSIYLSNQLLPFPESAGVNSVRIAPPAGFAWDARWAQRVVVEPDWEGGKPLRVVSFDAAKYPGKDEVAVLPEASGGELRLVLGSQMEAKERAQARLLKLSFPLRALPDASGASGSFTVSVNAEQFAAMPKGLKNRYSTAGWERSVYLGPWQGESLAAKR